MYLLEHWRNKKNSVQFKRPCFALAQFVRFILLRIWKGERLTEDSSLMPILHTHRCAHKKKDTKQRNKKVVIGIEIDFNASCLSYSQRSVPRDEAVPIWKPMAKLSSQDSAHYMSFGNIAHLHGPYNPYSDTLLWANHLPKRHAWINVWNKWNQQRH